MRALPRTDALLLTSVPFLSFAAPAPGQDLLVSSRFTDEVLRYDGTNGAFVGVFASGGGLDNPVGLTFGPDEDLYVASGDTDEVLRYDGASGAFVEVFASGGGLSGPRQIQFGPDGHLYVASGGGDEVLRYDGGDGTFLGVFTQGGNLNGPNGITFGPGGHLYVAAVLNNRVKVYDGGTGAFLGDFVNQQLAFPHDASFGPDGDLYVTNASSTRISRYDRTSGAYLGDFVDDTALSAALGMVWRPDGDLLVVNQGGDEVRRYDGATGALVSVFVPPMAGGVDSPLYATCMRVQGGASMRDPFPGLAGTDNQFVVEGTQPGALVVLVAGSLPGLRRIGGCSGASLAIGNPRAFALRFADESGRAVVRRRVPGVFAGSSLLLQAVDLARCDVTQLVTFVFP